MKLLEGPENEARQTATSTARGYRFTTILESAKAAALLLLGVAALLAAVTAYTRDSYQLVQLGEYRRDQFLLNTRSGQVWQSVCLGQTSGLDCSGGEVWVPMRRR